MVSRANEAQKSTYSDPKSVGTDRTLHLNTNIIIISIQAKACYRVKIR